MIITLFFLDFDSIALRVFGGLWVLLTIPVVFLHLEYYLRNRNMYFEIGENHILVKEGLKNEVDYRFEDLSKVILYKSASIDKGGIPFTPIEFYHYARVIPKNGGEIIITCLMTPDVEAAVSKLKWVSYERKKIFFASISQ